MVGDNLIVKNTIASNSVYELYILVVNINFNYLKTTSDRYPFFHIQCKNF